MRYLVLASSMAALIAMSGVAGAQSQPNPLDMIPDKMPFDVPYGAPIGIDRAKAVIAAAAEEAKKHGWKMNITVVDSGGISSPSNAWTARNSRRSPFPSTRPALPSLFAARRKPFEWHPERPELSHDSRRRDRLTRRHSPCGERGDSSARSAAPAARVRRTRSVPRLAPLSSTRERSRRASALGPLPTLSFSCREGRLGMPFARSPAGFSKRRTPSITIPRSTAFTMS